MYVHRLLHLLFHFNSYLLSKLLDDVIFGPIDDMPQLNLPALYFKQHVVKQVGLAGVDPLLDNLFLILPVGIRALEVPREGFWVHLVFLGLLHEAATLSTYDLLLEGLGYSFLNKSAPLVRA